MKHTTGPRRGRPRGNGKRYPSGKNQTFESTGSESKIRGSAQQVHERYLSLARDALLAGDRIAAEGHFQFADHYFRIVNVANANNPNPNNPNANTDGQGRPDDNNRPPASEPAAGGIAVNEPEAQAPQVTQTEAPQVTRTEAPQVTPVQATQVSSDDSVGETASAKSASQAEELAQALSRVDAAPDAEPASANAAPRAGGDDAASAPPKRRRRSPLGVAGKRSSGRPRKAEAAAETGTETPPAKPVRSRTRKPAAAKTGDPAIENA